MNDTGAKWRITVIKRDAPPFNHHLRVEPPEPCGCAWVCRSIAAAMRIVDDFQWLRRHPEIDSDVFDRAGYTHHLDHQDEAMKARR